MQSSPGESVDPEGEVGDSAVVGRVGVGELAGWVGESAVAEGVGDSAVEEVGNSAVGEGGVTQLLKEE